MARAQGISERAGARAGLAPRGGSGALLDAVTTAKRIPVLPVASGRLSPSTRWMIGLAGVVVLCVLLALALRAIRDPLRFPVSSVDVNGTLDYSDRDRLQRLVQDFTAAGFYAMNIGALRRELERLPWVAEARIAREWPGRLEVTIEEHEPTARWNKDALISKRQVLFHPPQLQPDDARHVEWRRVFAALPALTGAEGRHEAVLDDFRRHAARLAAADLRLVRLEEDDRRSQSAVLANEVTVRLGYEERELRMSRFLDVYPRVMDQTGNGAGPDAMGADAADAADAGPISFDMRYSDGFAVTDGGGR